MNRKAIIALKKWREENKGRRIEQSDPYEKSFNAPHSLRKAINGKCFECQGGGIDPGVIDRIAYCPAYCACSLWTVRPYQKRYIENYDENKE